MTHETIKDKIYEIICNGNHSTELILERARKLGIGDDEIIAAFVGLKADKRIREIEGFYHSNIMQRDSGNRICAAFALYAGRNLVRTFKGYWFDSWNEIHRFAEGMNIGAYAFRKRPAVAVYLRMEDDSYILYTTKNIDNRMYIPSVL